MNNKRRILALLLSLVLTLGAAPAWAVSFAGAFDAASGGEEDTRNMTNSDTTFCFLNEVSVRDTDTFEELATCSIFADGGVWVLTADVDEVNDADVFCRAFCFNN